MVCPMASAVLTCFESSSRSRVSELRAKAEVIELATMAILQCRAEIRQLGKRIRDIGDPACGTTRRRSCPVDGLLGSPISGA